MINQENKDVLNEYAKIKSEIKLLEAKADELNPRVLEVMQTLEVEEIAIGELGKVSLGSRRTWKYTTETLNLKKSFEEAKKFEEQTGKADYTEKHYVIFKSLNENDYE